LSALHDWAKFCKALSKNASWAAIVLVAKGRQISPLIWVYLPLSYDFGGIFEASSPNTYRSELPFRQNPIILLTNLFYVFRP
jgi:fumarate reductase subunit C